MPPHDGRRGQGGFRDEDDQASRHLLRIRRILENKIVPSLILDPATVIPAPGTMSDKNGRSDALVALALQGREDTAREEIRGLIREGMGFEEINLGLLAPAANKLGELWETDSVSFVDVTVAVGTLNRLMQFMAMDLSDHRWIAGNGRSICVFPEPGAEHTFGAAMAARFFEFAGWNVSYVPDGSAATLRNIMSTRSIDVMGLSLARAEVAGLSGELVRDLRKVSKNRNVVAIAGGSALVRNPLLMEGMGLDAVVAAIANATFMADDLAARSAGRDEPSA